MKTDNISSGEAIWTNNVDLLSEENCLPIIGSCQISTLLSNLDPTQDKIGTEQTQPEEVCIIDNDLRLLSPAANSIQNNYVVLKDNCASNTNDISSEHNKKSINSKNGSNNFEDMLYFVCNLCPFLCTKKSKITDHLDNAHKNKTVRKLPHLKCPACENVFFHKMSLRSHLIHDHGVGNSDIAQIIQGIVYNANRAKNNDNNKSKLKLGAASNKQIKVDPNFDVNVVNNNGIAVGADSQVLKNAAIVVPKVEISQNNTEKMFNNMMNPQPQSNNTKLIQIGAKNVQKCTISSCKITLQSAVNMSYHINCHKDNGFVCLICNDSFSFWKPLSSHLWRLHKIDMELYSCDKCDYKSVSLAKLNNIHKLIHGDVKAYVCPVCKKAFKNSKQLGNHKITHKSEFERTKFTCELCSKNFSDKRQLRIHMNVVHEKIKPFLCNYCGYKGSSRSSLKMHIRQHTGEKPFTCDSCSYKTSDHNSLRRHKLRHSGQKPYKCSYCSYACIQSSTYKVHLKTKHPGQEKDLMFTCQECQFRSVNKEMFISHMVTVHDQRPELI